jgi:hypothetical protein
MLSPCRFAVMRYFPHLGVVAVRGCSSMVEQKPSKLMTRVRFPSPAPTLWPLANPLAGSAFTRRAHHEWPGLAPSGANRQMSVRPRSVAQWLEHRSPKPGVGGSSPSTPARAAAKTVETTESGPNRAPRPTRFLLLNGEQPFRRKLCDGFAQGTVFHRGSKLLGECPER